MAKRCLRSEDVLRAVLESDSDSDIDAGSDVSNDKNSDEDDRALQDAAFDVQVDATTSDGDDIGDVEGGSTTSDDSVSDEQQWTCPTFLWRPAAGELPFVYPFSGACGFNVDVTGFSPTQFFYQLFVSPDLIRHFVVQTNIFADQFIQSHPQLPPHSRVHKWIETNEEEMKKFLALVLLMGIIHKPQVEMYWSTDILYSTPVFSAVMTCNRFELLLKFFHLNDNANEPDKRDPARDRLFKLRPLIDHLFEYFQSTYTPGPSVAVDETLMLWKGRLHFRQYLPLKRARFGIKMFCLAEHSGYIYRFRIYTGKEDPMTSVSTILPTECQNFGGVTKKWSCTLHCHFLTMVTHCGWTTGISVASCTNTFTAGKLRHVVP